MKFSYADAMAANLGFVAGHREASFLLIASASVTILQGLYWNETVIPMADIVKGLKENMTELSYSEKSKYEFLTAARQLVVNMGKKYGSPQSSENVHYAMIKACASAELATAHIVSMIKQDYGVSTVTGLYAVLSVRKTEKVATLKPLADVIATALEKEYLPCDYVEGVNFLMNKLESGLRLSTMERLAEGLSIDQLNILAEFMVNTITARVAKMDRDTLAAQEIAEIDTLAIETGIDRKAA